MKKARKDGGKESDGRDYEKIGLRCGIEIHQQMDTGRKLFCECLPRLSPSGPDGEFTRKLRVVAGESGEIDVAAMNEFLKGREFVYRTYPEETCLVEADEEPPHPMSGEALELALTVSRMLGCSFPDEVHVMRKTVLDGSNTSGFQRTAIAGTGGVLNTDHGDVGIENVCVEEESAQIIERGEKKVVYGLDRLGIPLIEIGTAPDIRHPQQAGQAAGKLGMILRSTGKAKRGLGTIRQDVNVSIKGGARVEIKGAQDLKAIPSIIDGEITRQRSLMEIKKELKRSGFKKVKPELVHASRIFGGSGSKITRGKTTYAIHVPGFAGFLKRNLAPGLTLGNEIAGYVRARTELEGIIHSDEELEKYRLSDEFEKLRKHVKAKKGDTLIIAVGEKPQVERTMEVVCARINLLAEGVPEEVRRARKDGGTEYLRPMPGSARLYPETDIPPIKITPSRLSAVKKNLPELITDRKKRMKKELKKRIDVSDEMIKQIINSGRKDLLDSLLGKGFDPKIVSNTLTSTLSYLEKKEKADVSRLKGKHFSAVFSALKKGKITKEAIPKVLKAFAENPGADTEEVIKKLGLGGLSGKELKAIVGKTIKENSNLLGNPRAEKILLGLVMKKVRGKADAGKVMDILKRKLRKLRK